MKHPLAFVMGITGDMAFAAATVVQALYRHNRDLDYEVVLMTSHMPEGDRLLLEQQPRCRFVPFEALSCELSPRALELFSPFALSKFEIFKLLDKYHTVVWLDADVVVQDSLRDLVLLGPLALALEDPHFTGQGTTSAVGINFYTPVPEYNMGLPLYNSGVIVVQDTLDDPHALYTWCVQCAITQGPNLKYPDQGVLNLLAQHFPELVTPMPYERFNAHPRDPASLTAPLVHAFGAYKLWNDGLSSCSFPEWRRDYERWVALGGTPFQGQIDNVAFLEGGPFFMLRRLFDTIENATAQLAKTADQLRHEQEIRAKLEKMIERFGTSGKV